MVILNKIEAVLVLRREGPVLGPQQAAAVSAHYQKIRLKNYH